MSKKTKAQVEGTLVKTDGTHEDVVRDGKFWELADLQKLVGGYIELIPMPSNGKVMIADEDGMPKQLAANPAATTYAGRPIVGNVVIVRRKDLK